MENGNYSPESKGYYEYISQEKAKVHNTLKLAVFAGMEAIVDSGLTSEGTSIEDVIDGFHDDILSEDRAILIGALLSDLITKYQGSEKRNFRYEEGDINVEVEAILLKDKELQFENTWLYIFRYSDGVKSFAVGGPDFATENLGFEEV